MKIWSREHWRLRLQHGFGRKALDRRQEKDLSDKEPREGRTDGRRLRCELHTGFWSSDTIAVTP